MSEQESVFKGTLEDIERTDLEKPIAGAKDGTCSYYVTPFSSASKEAEEGGDGGKAAVYKFMGTICSFQLGEGDPSKPFTPMWTMDGQRSLVPDDLQESDFEILKAVANRLTDPTLRARMFDVLWERRRKHEFCREAAKSYLAAAVAVDVETGWVHAVKLYRRGLRLSFRLGRGKAEFEHAVAILLEALNRDATTEEGFRTAQLLRLASDIDCGEPSDLAEIARSIGERAVESEDYRRARSYWELETDFLLRAKDKAGAKDAGLRAAETFVTEALRHIEDGNPSYMAASGLLKSGVEALRRAGGQRERIADLKRTLVEYQERALGEMQQFEHSVDIADLVKGAREHVAGREWIDALQHFAFGTGLVKLEELKASVIQNAKDFPLQHLFGGSLVDNKGRTSVNLPGLSNLEGKEAEEALEAEMFSHLSKFQWGLRVSGFIEPARVTILNDHHPELGDLLFLVQNNPFVPPGHEGIFLRGLHAGFHGDFLVAAHLLVPQIENSIRYVLEGNGADVSNLLSDGTQPVKVLGPLFDLKETTEIFTESVVFELRGLLIEKRGADFRNRTAHGFVSEGECYSAPARILWWLVLRFCLMPVLRKLDDGRAAK